MPEENKKPLDWRSALARIRQERSDVSKALTATQADLGDDLTKEGESRGWGGGVGKYAGPLVLDWVIGSLLDMVAPGAGKMYQAAKKVPILKAGGTALYSGVGTKVGADIGGEFTDVRDVEPLMEKYLGKTMSGQRASRFDRGGTESLASQRDLQLDVLDDLVSQSAITNAGSAFLKSITGDVMGNVGEEYKERLNAIRANRELTSQDYLDVLLEAGGKGKSDKSVLGSIFDFSPLSGKNLQAAGAATGDASSVKEIIEGGLPGVGENVDVELPGPQEGIDVGFNTEIKNSYSPYVASPDLVRNIEEPIGYNKIMSDLQNHRGKSGRRNYSYPSNDYLMSALFGNSYSYNQGG